MSANSALSVWQLAIMAVVPVTMLAVWLIAIFLAAADPGGRQPATTASPAEPAAAGTAEHEPAAPRADRVAA